MNNTARRLAVTLTGWRLFVAPGLLADSRFDFLGLITRPNGEQGALARIQSTGLLVQVNAGVIRTLDQRKAEAALKAAQDAAA